MCTHTFHIGSGAWLSPACSPRKHFMDQALQIQSTFSRNSLCRKAQVRFLGLFYSLTGEICETKLNGTEDMTWNHLCVFHTSISQNKFFYKDLELQSIAFGSPFLEIWLSETEILGKPCLSAQQYAEGNCFQVNSVTTIYPCGYYCLLFKRSMAREMAQQINVLAIQA